MIKQFLKQIGVALFITFTMGQLAYAATKNSEQLDRIVAVINDSVITQSELTQTMNNVTKQFQSTNTPVPADDVLYKQVLDQLINKKLQLQLAEQMGIQVTDEDLNKTIHGIAENNKISDDELYKKIKEQGISTEDYRHEIHEQLILHQVQQQAIGNKISITPKEVDDFMRSKSYQTSNTKEYHLQDILIALPDTPSSQDVIAARKHAEEIVAKIHHGLSFHDAAIAESGEKALEGGDLGWRKVAEIPSIFADEVIHLNPNDLLGPVQAPNGFHIVLLSGVRDAGKKITLAEQKKQVEQLIYQRKIEESMQSWLTKLRSEAFINTHPENTV